MSPGALVGVRCRAQQRVSTTMRYGAGCFFFHDLGFASMHVRAAGLFFPFVGLLSPHGTLWAVIGNCFHVDACVLLACWIRVDACILLPALLFSILGAG